MQKTGQKWAFSDKGLRTYYTDAYFGDLLLPKHILSLFPLNIDIGLTKNQNII